MMTRFDWYFFRVALVNLILTTLGIGVVYITIDVVINLDRFRDHGSSIGDVVHSYAMTMPSILYLLGPLIVLLSGNFAVTRMLRSREHLALQACGLRGFRTLRSFWMVALLASVFLLGMRLWLLPGLEEQEAESVLGNLRKASGLQTTLWDVEGNHWSATSYQLLESPPRLNDVRVIRHIDGRAHELIRAKVLHYIDNTWRGDALVTTYADIENLSGGPTIEERTNYIVPHTSLTPGAVTRRGERRNFPALTSLTDAIAGQPHRRDLRLNLHRLWSWPLSAFVLMLGGAALCLRTRVRNPFVATGLTLVLAFATLALTLSLEKLALNGSVEPMLAAYTAPLIVLIYAVISLRWRVD